jgi:hypothetical protein
MMQTVSSDFGKRTAGGQGRGAQGGRRKKLDDTKRREIAEAVISGHQTRGRSITACMKDVSRYLTGWMSHFRLCTSEAVEGLRVIDAHVRRRVRAIIVRQRKRNRFLFRHLRSRGVSIKAAANCAYCGRGAWVKSAAQMERMFGVSPPTVSRIVAAHVVARP